MDPSPLGVGQGETTRQVLGRVSDGSSPADDGRWQLLLMDEGAAGGKSYILFDFNLEAP